MSALPTASGESGPALTEYGNRELRVRDLDGHVLCFAVLRDDVTRGEG